MSIRDDYYFPEIKFDIWYYFENDIECSVWLAYIKEKYNIDYLLPVNQPHCLRLCSDPLRVIRVNYGTNYCKAYMDVVRFEVISKRHITEQVKWKELSFEKIKVELKEIKEKGENEMDPIKTLLSKYYTNRYAEIINTCDNLIKETKSNTLVGKAIGALVKEVNAARRANGILTPFNISIEDSFSSDDYSPEVSAIIKAAKDDMWTAEIELSNKCEEIESLLNLCDTYEQKIDILTKYNIIQLPKK